MSVCDDFISKKMLSSKILFYSIFTPKLVLELFRGCKNAEMTFFCWASKSEVLYMTPW